MLKYMWNILKHIMRKFKSKKPNKFIGFSAVDGGSVPLSPVGRDTNDIQQIGQVDSLSSSSKRELCFLKFYNCLDDKKKEQWLDNFKNNMTDILLSEGFDRIKKMCELLDGPRPSERWRIIYSHRHMGATRLLEAIKTVWTGKYEGSKVYYNKIQKKERPCKLV